MKYKYITIIIIILLVCLIYNNKTIYESFKDDWELASNSAQNEYDWKYRSGNEISTRNISIDENNIKDKEINALYKNKVFNGEDNFNAGYTCMFSNSPWVKLPIKDSYANTCHNACKKYMNYNNNKGCCFHSLNNPKNCYFKNNAKAVYIGGGSTRSAKDMWTGNKPEEYVCGYTRGKRQYRYYLDPGKTCGGPKKYLGKQSTMIKCAKVCSDQKKPGCCWWGGNGKWAKQCYFFNNNKSWDYGNNRDRYAGICFKGKAPKPILGQFKFYNWNTVKRNILKIPGNISAMACRTACLKDYRCTAWEKCSKGSGCSGCYLFKGKLPKPNSGWGYKFFAQRIR